MATLHRYHYSKEDFLKLADIGGHFYSSIRKMVHNKKKKEWKKAIYEDFMFCTPQNSHRSKAKKTNSSLYFKLFYVFRLKQMPLYLNHEDVHVRSLVKWRLLIGK